MDKFDQPPNNFHFHTRKGLLIEFRADNSNTTIFNVQD